MTYFAILGLCTVINGWRTCFWLKCSWVICIDRSFFGKYNIFHVTSTDQNSWAASWPLLNGTFCWSFGNLVLLIYRPHKNCLATGFTYWLLFGASNLAVLCSRLRVNIKAESVWYWLEEDGGMGVQWADPFLQAGALWHLYIGALEISLLTYLFTYWKMWKS